MNVAVVTLGCARNEVDSEELAGRLEAGGFVLVEDLEDADTVLVNTCGFVEAAKKDSVDTLLEAADLKASAGNGGRAQAVVAVGCLAERYGKDLAESLPEADAVLGFDDYPDIASKLRAIVAGETHHPHTPSDRRRLLPISPVDRDASGISVPGHQDASTPAAMLVAEPGDLTDIGAGAPATGPRAVRRRLDAGPMAPLKLASGCDRRCTFCAIPSFRGSFVSRRPSDVVAEARWLATQGVKELFLVSENSTSYGKDLGDLRLLETLLPELSGIDGVERVRVSYLQPAETRPGLIEAIASTPGVVPYFDLSFQHASATVLRRMRRFGDPESFLGLLDQVRTLAPLAGVRSNVIVGFPGETEDELQVLCDFLEAARMDVTGVFGYSDEDGTEAAGFADHLKLDEDEIRARTEHVTALVEELNAQRAEERVGEEVVVLVESVEDGVVEGRAAHQGPEVDGTTLLLGAADAQVGHLLSATVTGTDGVDLVARVDGAAR
ncbi:30S ribosomal protein S12 methylthiotransferase RimO [Nocardioides sp. S-58]|uniref:Ribosomal protein uS12 methylthiotransferase RimO n=1 Tax=Nocardioides renjunii TaxID=3095075 RepID=A0ABU5KBL4_9ACTN|nr:30S ribosomal protein S12 methylthiotransferase RimO [Nocardioides sp. S-58]MDZ5661809.1 30S ribosomal protein S12 methylthiotransferase RimO [Nocardioides sp. S-58]